LVAAFEGKGARKARLKRTIAIGTIEIGTIETGSNLFGVNVFEAVEIRV
jgi:hypothetical protein